MSKINFSSLSDYRTELMGAAMLFVMLFHVGMDRHSTFYALHRIGNVGVDIFLLLSGIGLWYAWQKKPSLKHFYWRRFVRLYPAWLIMAMLFYIPNHINTPGGGYSPDIINLVLNILFGWSFWRCDDLTFWFIPAIMALYLVAPFYLRLIRRNPSWVMWRYSGAVCQYSFWASTSALWWQRSAPWRVPPYGFCYSH